MSRNRPNRQQAWNRASDNLETINYEWASAPDVANRPPDNQEELWRKLEEQNKSIWVLSEQLNTLTTALWSLMAQINALQTPSPSVPPANPQNNSPAEEAPPTTIPQAEPAQPVAPPAQPWQQRVVETQAPAEQAPPSPQQREAEPWAPELPALLESDPDWEKLTYEGQIMRLHAILTDADNGLSNQDRKEIENHLALLERYKAAKKANDERIRLNNRWFFRKFWEDTLKPHPKIKSALVWAAIWWTLVYTTLVGSFLPAIAVGAGLWLGAYVLGKYWKDIAKFVALTVPGTFFNSVWNIWRYGINGALLLPNLVSQLFRGKDAIKYLEINPWIYSSKQNK